MTCHLSIIIPTYQETDKINRVLDHIKKQDFQGSYEIIVVDGSETNETLSAIHDVTVVKISCKKGRGRQMNQGAAKALGNILLFLHADTLLPACGLARIARVQQQSNVVGGAFDLGIGSRKKAFRIIEAMVYWRTRLTRIPYGDQAIFIKKDYFNRIGGFRHYPIMEDVELMRRIRQKGDRITVIPFKVLTSPRRWEKDGIVFCTLRNWALICLYLMGVTPNYLSKFYR